jgi:hypothetical protein
MQGPTVRRAALLMGLLAVTAAGTANTFTSGVWRGAAERDEAGRFLDCTMTAQSQAGILIAFVVSRDFQWGLALADERWRLPVGEVQDIRLKIDGLSPMKAFAKMIDAEGMLIPFQKNDLALEALRRAKHLDIETPAGSFGFTLDGSGEAFDALSDCVRENLAEENAWQEPPD